MNRDATQPCVVILVPGFSVGGGVPQVAKYLVSVFRDQNWDCRVIELATSRRDVHSQRIMNPKTWLRGPQLTVPGPDGEGYAGSHFVEIEQMRYLQTAKLRRALDQFDLVIVVAGTPAWALAARGIKSPVILQVATTTSWERRSRDKQVFWWQRPYRTLMTQIAGILDRKGARVADLTLVYNLDMEQWATSQKRNSAVVQLIPPAIDTSVFQPSSSGWDSAGPLVSVGRLAETRKGWVRLLTAYAKLVAHDSTAPQLVIAGRGQLSKESLHVIESNYLHSRVHVYENPTQAELVALLASGSAFVTTPFEEGLGIAALEAMACGLPVIATETAGSRQYVQDGVTGFSLSQNDETMFDQFSNAVSAVRVDNGQMSDAAVHLVRDSFSREALDSQFVRLAVQTLKSNGQAKLDN